MSFCFIKKKYINRILRNCFLHIISLIILLILCFDASSQNYVKLKDNFERTFKAQKFDSALVYAQQSLIVAEKEHGSNDARYATALGNVAICFKQLGKYDKAETLLIESLNLKKTIFGEKHPNYANSLNSLAGVYLALGDYRKAEPLYYEAVNIYKGVIAGNPSLAPNYANTLNNVGNIYYSLGNYDKAESSFLDALNIRKSIYGTKHPLYSESLNSLAVLYGKIGNLNKSEVLYNEAMEIQKLTVGPKHPSYAQSLINLGELYIKTGNSIAEKDSLQKAQYYRKAEPLYQEALKIQKANLGDKHPDYLLTLFGLASLYNNLRKYSQAEPLYLEVLSTRRQTVGEKHPGYATAMNNLANMYMAMGAFNKAEPLFVDALKIRKDVLGAKHPDVAVTLENLATMYYEKKDYAKAESFFLENVEIRLYEIQNEFSFLSESEKEKFLATFKDDFDKFNSFAIRRYKDNPAISKVAYNNYISTKGLLLNSSIQLRQKILNSSDNKLIDEYNKWVLLKEKIGKYLELDEVEILKNKINIDSLDDIANQFEKELSRTSDIFANDRKINKVTWFDVQKNLNVDEAAVELVDFRNYYSKHFSDTTIYCAYIIKSGYTQPILVTLCKSTDLEEKMKVGEETVDNMYVNINSYVANKAESKILYNMIWHKVDSIIGNVKKVYISLGGLTNKISFAALNNNQNKLLIDCYDITYINNTRSLAYKETTTSVNEKTSAIFGGIIYDMDIADVIKNTEPYRKGSVINTGMTPQMENYNSQSWSYLIGTLTEATQIEEVLKNNGWSSKFYNAGNASEEAFKSLQGNKSPTVIHISTHGFFFPDPKLREQKSDTHNESENLFKSNSNPLYRSGLIMAGGNRVWKGAPPIDGLEDGVLTAYDVSNTYLGSTDLVVLSACETGLGDIKSGEGVYGLQRSFQIAGAKSVIMSLWSVPDQETIELMQVFYSLWLKSGSRHESFVKAQQQLSKKYAPFYWAAFMMVE